MSEIRIEKQFTEVDMVCDSCGDGRMRPTGEIIRPYPPKFIHMCDNCLEVAIYPVKYPYIEEK